MHRVTRHSLVIAVFALLLAGPAASGAAESPAVDIMDLLDTTGAVLEWDEFTRSGVIWSGFDSISFSAGEPVAIADFNEIIRIDPIVYERGKLLVPERTFLVLSARLGSVADNAALRRVHAIVIDPGHGGRDPGTYRTINVDGRAVTYYEKDLVLDMAHRLKAELERLLDGTRLYLTRDTDVYLPLEARTEFAHSVRRDPQENVLFVSLHVNASALPWTQARGVEIYYLPATQRRQVLDAEIAASLQPEVSAMLNDMKEEEYTVESVLMGRAVLDAIAEHLPQTPIERGVRVANFFVVREARMPSILVETGFMNNREDLELLRTAGYRERLSAAIAAGIAGYVRDFEQLR